MSTFHMSLTIMFWNARSLVRKTQEFKMFISELNSIIIGVCETWLQPKLKYNLRGYSIYRKERNQRIVGGIACMIRHDVRCRQIKLIPFQNGVMETMAL